MDDGIYHITVTSSGGAVAGDVTVVDGRFNGEGSGYVFRGHLTDEGAAGVIEILKVVDEASPQLGLFKHISVPVSGTAGRRAFFLEGRINGHHVIEIRLEGEWMAESI